MTGISQNADFDDASGNGGLGGEAFSSRSGLSRQGAAVDRLRKGMSAGRGLFGAHDGPGRLRNPLVDSFRSRGLRPLSSESQSHVSASNPEPEKDDAGKAPDSDERVSKSLPRRKITLAPGDSTSPKPNLPGPEIKTPLVPRTERDNSDLELLRAPGLIDLRRITVSRSAYYEDEAAVLVSFDGTLFEAKFARVKPWKATFEHLSGRELSLNHATLLYDRCKARVSNEVEMAEAVRELIYSSRGERFPLELDELFAFRDDYFRDNIPSFGISPNEDILEKLTSLHSQGVPLALCSLSSSSFTDPILEYFGCDHLFEVKFCSDNLPPDMQKPAPAHFLLAAEALRVKPSECLVLEDCAVGLQAAVRAGMRAIVRPNSNDFDSFLLGVRDNVFPLLAKEGGTFEIIPGWDHFKIVG